MRTRISGLECLVWDVYFLGACIIISAVATMALGFFLGFDGFIRTLLIGVLRISSVLIFKVFLRSLCWHQIRAFSIEQWRYSFDPVDQSHSKAFLKRIADRHLADKPRALQAARDTQLHTRRVLSHEA